MNDVMARLKRLQAYMASKRGVPLWILYSVAGTEKTGTIADMIADHGAFVRVLGGSSLDDLDRMLQFEMQNINVIE